MLTEGRHKLLIFVISIIDVVTCHIPVIITSNGEMTNPRFSGNGETPLYWKTMAKDNLQRILNSRQNIGVAKNVILFLGDGMGVSTVTAARILQGQLRNQTGEETVLSWEKFPHVALSKTYNQDHQTPDSAGTATAFLCGVKTNKGMFGVDARTKRSDCESSKGAELSSIVNWSQNKDKSVGIVTTARITHATPAAGYAHTAERDWEGDSNMETVTGGCKDIARQLVEDNANIQVLMGGGRKFFLPYNSDDPEGYNLANYGRRDNRNLVQDWIDNKNQQNKKHKYVWNATEFYKVDPAKTDYLLGLFNADHMQYEIDRRGPKEKGGEPSLAEMTEKAIQILNKSENGYFLLVEGGRIDHGHHDSSAKRALHDTLAFADAVAKADKMTNGNDTLLIVTADHSHVFVISGYPSRGNPILGLTDYNGKAQLANDGYPFTTLMYANGPGAPINGVRQNLTNIRTDDDDFVFQSAIPLDSETHAGEDVAIYARGPMSHLFQGVHEQNYIAHVMAYASCVGDYQNKADCAASQIQTPIQATVDQIVHTNTGYRSGFTLSLLFIIFITSMLQDF